MVLSRECVRKGAVGALPSRLKASLLRERLGLIPLPSLASRTSSDTVYTGVIFLENPWDTLINEPQKQLAL